MFCLHICLCEGIRSPATGVASSFELLCGCWELNLHPLEEQTASALNLSSICAYLKGYKLDLFVQSRYKLDGEYKSLSNVLFTLGGWELLGPHTCSELLMVLKKILRKRFSFMSLGVLRAPDCFGSGVSYGQ